MSELIPLDRLFESLANGHPDRALALQSLDQHLRLLAADIWKDKRETEPEWLQDTIQRALISVNKAALPGLVVASPAKYLRRALVSRLPKDKPWVHVRDEDADFELARLAHDSPLQEGRADQALIEREDDRDVRRRVADRKALMEKLLGQAVERAVQSRRGGNPEDVRRNWAEIVDLKHARRTMDQILQETGASRAALHKRHSRTREEVRAAARALFDSSAWSQQEFEWVDRALTLMVRCQRPKKAGV